MPIGKICGNCAKKVILFRVHSSHNDGHCVPLSVYEATEKSTSRETSWEKSSHAAHWTLCHTHWREEKEKVQRSWRKLRWKRRRPLWGRAHKFASFGKKINFFCCSASNSFTELRQSRGVSTYTTHTRKGGQ